MRTGKARGFAYPALLVGILVFGIGLAKTGEWASKGSGRPLAAYSPTGTEAPRMQSSYADWKFVFDPNER
ncbi:hypothetical protein [Ralstonia solanacearum]|uniref:hypothetical protein n=1 Tax=Ralstonia solanacearum TaxID=305 RepID=UPI000F61D269|nr:hypothetical protein [Ralstonia solanacearum]